MSILRRTIGRGSSVVQKRMMGDGGHHHEGPHVPLFYDRLGKACLVTCFFWIMYRAKENKGQLLGLYLPWLHEHEHVHHHYEHGDKFGATMANIVEGHHEAHAHDDHEEEEEEEEHGHGHSEEDDEHEDN